MAEERDSKPSISIREEECVLFITVKYPVIGAMTNEQARKIINFLLEELAPSLKIEGVKALVAKHV